MFLLPLLVLSLHPTLVLSQTDYLPFVKEGKSWVYDHVNGRQQRVTLAMLGDTAVGGKTYKKVYSRGGGEGPWEYHCAVREADRRVYAVKAGEDGERLLFDFFLSHYNDTFALQEGAAYSLKMKMLVTTADGSLYMYDAADGAEKKLMEQGMNAGKEAVLHYGGCTAETLTVRSGTDISSSDHTYRVVGLAVGMDGEASHRWIEGIGFTHYGLTAQSDMLYAL